MHGDYHLVTHGGIYQNRLVSLMREHAIYSGDAQ
jgi:hypothetical protein